MTIPAVDCPYLGVVAEFDAATTPTPTHRPTLSTLLTGVVSKVTLAHRRQHRRSRNARAGHGGDSDSSVV